MNNRFLLTIFMFLILLSFSNVNSSQIKGTSLETGLISYYGFEETSGTTVSDSKGTNTGTINGATINQVGKVGKCYSYDGINDYIGLASRASLTGDFTIAWWQYFAVGAIVDNADGPVGRSGMDLNFNAGVLTMYTGTDVLVSSAAAKGSWQHWTIVRNGTTLRAYVNGVLATTNSNGGFGTFSFDWLGRVNAGYNGGYLDEIGIWGRSLSAAEVSQLYNSGSGLPYEVVTQIKGTSLETGLISYYPLDESSGITVTDSTNNKPGTNTNALIGRTGKIGTAYEFTGSNSYVNFANIDVDAYSTISYGGWFKADSLSNCIMGWNYDGTWGYTAIYLNPMLSYRFGSGSSATDYSGISSLSTGTWYHVIATKGTTYNKLYLNGAQVHSSATLSLANNVNYFRLANCYETQMFDGTIDEVGIWSKELSAAEVSQLYNSGSGIPYEVASVDPNITYVSPTPANGSTITTNSATIKVNLTNVNILNKVNFTWSGTSTSMNINTNFSDGQYSFGPSEGLVLYLPYENSGSLVDLSGTGNTATNVGATYNAIGKLGGAYSFDGINDYQQIASSNSLNFGTNPFTISGWMKVNGSGLVANNEYGIISKNSHYQAVPGWVIEISTYGGVNPNYNLGVAITSQSTWCTTCASVSNLTSDVWKHFILLRNSTGVYVYLDGVLMSSNTHADTQLSVTNSEVLKLGDHSWGPNFPGTLDDIRLYNRSLTESEIKYLYNSKLQRINSANYILEVNKTNLSFGQYNYSLAVTDSISTGTSSQSFSYPLPQIKGTTLATGLVTYWQFNETSGNVIDYSGQGFDGTTVSATRDQLGKIGTAYTYDGSTNYVSSTSGPSFTGDMSVSMWIKHTGSGGVVLSSYNAGWKYISRQYPGSTAGFDIVTDGTWKTLSVSGVPAVGNWYHFVYVRNGTNGTIYLNGVAAGSATQAGALTISSAKNYLMTRSVDNVEYVAGSVDEFGLWNRPLTTTEISNLYNSGSGIPYEVTNTGPTITFVSPTPANGSTIYQNSATIKVNLTNVNILNKINFTWNGATKSMYLNSSSTSGVYPFTSSDGLVMYLALENGTYNDLTGRGYTVTKYNQAAQTIGKYGNALTFDGDTDYLNVTSLNNFQQNMTSFTISAWIFPTDFDHADYPHIMNNQVNTIAFHLQGPAYGVNKGKVGFYLQGPSQQPTDRACALGSSNVPLTLNTWQHVVVTCNSSGSTMYINGVLDHTSSANFVTGLPTLTEFHIGVGYGAPTVAQSFKGKIDEVRIYNRTLTTTEIGELYNTTAVLVQSSFSNYVLDVNKTNLSYGQYNYSLAATDSIATITSAQTFNYSIGGPTITFVSPTPANGSTITTNNATIKANFTNVNILNKVNFTWNGDNYVMYDDTTLLHLNLNNNANIGETSSKVVDVSRNANNGTITGAVWNSTGKYGSALYFDGSGDYVDFGTSTTLCPSNFSVELWMKAGTQSKDHPSIICKMDSNNRGFKLALSTTASNTLTFYIGDGSGGGGVGYYSISTSNVTDNVWHHIVATYNGTNIFLYKDGVLVSNASWSKYGCANTGNYGFYLGVDAYDLNNRVYLGSLDEVILYNRSLTADEVAFNYNSNLYKSSSSNYVLDVNKTSLSVGQYNYSVLATDNSGTGNSAGTFNVTSLIVENLPIAFNVVIASSSGTNTSSENLTVYYNLSDLDGDPVSNITRWNKNGVPMIALYMPFKVGSNSTWTKDYSGFGKNGIVSGTAWNSTGGYGGNGAYTFASGTQMVTTSTAMVLNRSFTFMAWIYPTAVTATYGSCIICQDYMVYGIPDPSMNGAGLYIDPSTNKVKWKFYRSGASSEVESSALTLNRWYHLTGTFNGTHGCLFLNGSLYGSCISISNYNADPTGLIGIGNSPKSFVGLQDFIGNIDDVRIYNYSLSSAQIKALYENKTDLIVSDETSIGEVWQACVTPNDGKSDGATVCSNTLEVFEMGTSGIQFFSPTPYSGYLAANKTFDIRAYVHNTTTLSSFKFTIGNYIYNYINSSLLLRLPYDSFSLQNDTSQYGINGTCSGATCPTQTTGKYAEAYSFDGVDDYFDLGNPNVLKSMTKSQTICMWLYPTDLTVRRNPYNKAYGGEGTITQETSGSLSYYYGTAGADNSPYQGFGSPADSVQTNTWTHACIVRDLDAMQLYWYINGQLRAQTTATYATATASNQNAYIGKGYAGNFVGKIDDVHIYNRSLSFDEVKMLYGTELRRETSTRWIFAVSNITHLLGGGYTYNVTSVGTSTLQSESRIVIIPAGISFTSPTESGLLYNRDYLAINVTVDDYNSENLQNITLFFYNSTGLKAIYNSTTRPFFANITGLSNGQYWYNATAYYSNADAVSTETRNATISSCVTVANSSTVYVNASQTLTVCNGQYSNVYFKFNGAGGRLIATGATFTGTHSGNAIELNSSNDNISIEGGYFQHYSKGLYATAGSSNYIENLTIYNTIFSSHQSTNMYLYYVRNSLINKTTSNSADQYYGIELSYCTGIIIYDSDFNYNSNYQGRGIYLSSYTNTITIDRCRLYSNGINIYLGSSWSNTIRNSNLTGYSSTTAQNIYLNYANANSIYSNRIRDAQSQGIRIDNSDSPFIYDNYFSGNGAIYPSNFDYTGVYSYTSTNIRLNTTLNCNRTNIIGGPCTGGNYYSEFTGLDDGSGIGPIYNVSGDTIADNSYFSPYGGGTDYLPLTTQNNSCFTPTTGISYIVGSNTTLCSGTYNNAYFELVAPNSYLRCLGTVLNGTHSNSGISISGNADNSRVENCYLQHYSQGISVSGTSSSNYLENLTIYNTTFSSHGSANMYFSYLRNSVINKTISNSADQYDGLRMYNSYGNIIYDSDFNYNSNYDGKGIRMESSCYSNIIDSCRLYSNGINIVLSSSWSNIIRNSNITGSSSTAYNLRMDSASSNQLYGNRIRNAQNYGIILNYGDNNVFYDNYFSGNGASSPSSLTNGAIYNTNINTLYLNTTLNCNRTNIIGGPCTGGNYYDEFSGLDDGSGAGPAYNVSGDTIADNSYFRPYGTGTDYLPLTTQTGSCFTPSNNTVYRVGTNSTMCSGTYTNVYFRMAAPNSYLRCLGTVYTGTHANAGVYLDGMADNSRIEGCYFQHYTTGISASAGSSDYLDNLTIYNNTLSSHSSSNMYFSYLRNSVINKTISNSADQYDGLRMYNSYGNIIYDSDFNYNSNYDGKGIRIESGCYSNIIDSCRLYSNGMNIVLSSSWSNIIRNSNITGSSSTVYNIQFSSASSNQIYSNRISSAYQYGIYMASSDSPLIYDNYFVNNGWASINSVSYGPIYSSSVTNIRLNTTLNCNRTNILGGPCTGGNYYSQFTGLDNGFGIAPYNISGDKIADNSYFSPYGGGTDYLPLTTQNGSCFTPSNSTVYIVGSNSTMCSGVYNNVYFKLQAPNGYLRCLGGYYNGTHGANSISMDGLADNSRIEGCSFQHYSRGIDASGSSSNYIENLTLYNTSFSSHSSNNIYFYYVRNSLVNKTISNAADQYDGLHMYYSYGNIIYDSDFNYNSNYDGKGIRMESSCYSNTIDSCRFYSNAIQVYLSNSWSNIIRNNTLTGYSTTTSRGIELSSANSNQIYSNRITASSGYGISISAGSGNIIYNNYLQNTNNAYVSAAGVASWNTTKNCDQRNIVFGECIGGNYWHNYVGVDANTDGIGDTPHTFTSGGVITDNLPLMKTYIVDSCKEINLTGEHYLISNLNVGVTTPCIIIKGNGITLNLNGYTITNSNSGPSILINGSNNAIVYNGIIQSGTYSSLGSIRVLDSNASVRNINFNNINCNVDNCGAIYSEGSTLSLTNLIFNGVQRPVYSLNSVSYTNLSICNSSNTNCIKWLTGTQLNNFAPILGQNILIAYDSLAVNVSDSKINGLNTTAEITLSTITCPVDYYKYNGLTLDVEEIVINGISYTPSQFSCGSGKTTFTTYNAFSSYALAQVDRDFEILNDMYFLPSNPKEGDRVYVFATLNSTVLASSIVRVGLLVDNVQIDYVDVNVIENGTTPITLSFVPLISRDYNASIKADSNNMYIEISEINNLQQQNIFVLRTANATIIYPTNGSTIIRGQNAAREDTFRLVNETSNLTARVTSLNGSAVNSTCYFYVNGTLVESNATNVNGTCYVNYDKTSSLLGSRNVSVNFTLLEDNATYSANPFTAVVQSLVIANASIVPSNYRAPMNYSVGDAVVTNVLTYYDNVPVNVHDFILYIGGSSSMACPYYELPNASEAWFVLRKNNSQQISTGNYKLTSVLNESHNENIHWCLYVYDSNNNTIITSSHQDILIQDADSSLQFNVLDASNNTLVSNITLLDRNGITLLSTNTSNVSRSAVIGDNHTLIIMNSANTFKFNNLNITSDLVSFGTYFITYNGVKPFTGTGSITKLLYLTNSTELNYDNVQLYFQSNVDSRIVYKCEEYDYVLNNCSVWSIHSPLGSSSNSTHVWFNATEFSGYMYGPEQTQINVWDSADPDMPYGGQLIKQNRTAYFYANYTGSNNVSLSGSTCTINFGSGALSMSYNSTSGYYYYSRSFVDEAIYYYNITCKKNGYTGLNVTGDISVSSSPPSYITNVLISPDVAYKNTSINCTGTIYDDDDITGLTMQFDFMNGVTTLYSTSISGLTNGSTRTATMTSNYFSKGMNVTCKVRGSDGTSYGAYTTSSEVYVENSVPIWQNPTNLINANTSNVGSFTLQCTDPDSDVLTYVLNDTFEGMLSINSNKIEWLLWNESNKSTRNIIVNCTDTFANVSKEFIYNISDTTKPEYSNMINTTTNIYRYENVTFTSTFSDYAPNKVYFFYDIGTGSYSNISFDWVNREQTFSTSINITSVPGKNNRFYWRGVDTSNNQLNTSITNFTSINRAPLFVSQIPNRTINQNENNVINLSNYYSDPDNEILNYTVDSKSSANLNVRIVGTIATINASTPSFEWVEFRGTDYSGESVKSNRLDVSVLRIPLPPEISDVEINGMPAGELGGLSVQTLGFRTLSDNQLRILEDIPEVTDLDIVTITARVFSESLSTLTCETESSVAALNGLPVSIILGDPNRISFTTALVPNGIHNVNIVCTDKNGIASTLTSLKVVLYPTDLSMAIEDVEFVPANPNVDQEVTAFFNINNTGIREATNVRVNMYVDNISKGYFIIPEIPVGESREGFKTFTLTSSGYHQVQFLVDPSNTIPEFDETNNEITKLILAGRTDQVDLILLPNVEVKGKAVAGQTFTLNGPALYDLPANSYPPVQGGTTRITFQGVTYNGYSDRYGDFPGVVITAPSAAEFDALGIVWPGSKTYPVEVYVSDGNVQGFYQGEIEIFAPEPPPVFECNYPNDLPNLSAISITHPSYILVNGTYTFYVTVGNGNSCNSTTGAVPGSYADYVPIKVTNGTHTIFEVNRTTPLVSNQNVTYSFTWKVPNVGSNVLFLSINGDKYIPEQDKFSATPYANNYLTKSFYANVPAPPINVTNTTPATCDYYRIYPNINVYKPSRSFNYDRYTHTDDDYTAGAAFGYGKMTYGQISPGGSSLSISGISTSALSSITFSTFNMSFYINDVLYDEQTFSSKTISFENYFGYPYSICTNLVGPVTYKVIYYGVTTDGCLFNGTYSKIINFVQSPELVILNESIEFYPKPSSPNSARIIGSNFTTNFTIQNRGNLAVTEPINVSIRAYRVTNSGSNRILTFYGEQKVPYSDTLNGFTGGCGENKTYSNATIYGVNFTSLPLGRYALFAMVDNDNVIDEVYEGRYNSSTNPYGNEYEITELEIVEAGPKVNATISIPSRTVRYMPTSFSITYTNTGIDPAVDMPYVVVFQHANGTNQTIDSDFIWNLPVGGTTTKNYQIAPTELGICNVTVYYNYTFNTITTQKSNVRNMFVGLPEIAIRSEDISFSDDFVKPGETVNVTTFIRNLGPYAAYNITSVLFVNQSESDDWLTILISNGGYSIVRFNFTVTFPDHHLIQVSANDDLRQYEVNQGDNIASKVMVYVYDDSLGNVEPYIEFNNLDNGYISGTVPLTSKVIDPDTDTSIFEVDFNITNSTDENYLFTVEEPIPGMSVQSGTGAFFGSDFNSSEYADGDYIFTVFTSDGTEPASNSSYPYIIDNTLPIVNIISPESESLIEGIVEINYTIVEANPRFAKYRYSNDAGTSWSSYSNLPGPIDYNGGVNSFGFDSSLCPDLKEPDCVIEVWCQDYAENVGSDTDNYKTNVTSKDDDDEDDEKEHVFDIDYELVCVPNEFTLHVNSKTTNVGGADVSILTPSNKLIKGKVVSGRIFTTYLDEPGVYSFEVNKFDFKTYKGTFVLLDCEEEIDEDKNIFMEVDFNCPGNVLSVMLRNNTDPIPEQKIQYYLGDLVYSSETDYNGYTSIAVNDIGTYTLFVASETYNMLMEDYTVSELCPGEEIIDDEDKDDDTDTEDEDKEPDELPYEQIEDSPRSLLERTLQFISPQLKIKSGCEGFYYEGLPLILCDLVWFIVLIESVLVGYIQFNNKRKYLLVILFAAPILMAIIFAPIYGAVLGALELGTSIYFYYRKKAREKYQYKKLEEELMR